MAWVKKRVKSVGIVGGAILAVLALCVLTLTNMTRASQYAISSEEIVDFSPVNQENEQIAYLTDGEWLPTSKAGWGTLLKDTTSNGTKISLNYDGTVLTFDRGVWAHATSNVDFDVRPYKDEYDYLLVYVGLNRTANSSGNVKFTVYTSDAEAFPSGANAWQVLPEMDGEVLTVASGAKFLKIDIKNINYIRFYANSNGSNGNDHAVYGDLKLVKADYGANDSIVPTVEQLDAKIRDQFGGLSLDDLEKNPDYQITVLRRTLIERMTRTTILSFLHESAANCDVFNWLYNNLEVLKMYINGGQLSTKGTYAQSLEVLEELYHTYKNDLEDNTPLSTTQGTRGNLYLRMMVTLSLTHSEHVRLWVRDRIVNDAGQIVTGEEVDSDNISRPVDRYAVYKRMYLAGKLNTQIFEQLEVEEMRYVMETMMGDDEVEWMHDWLEYKGRGPYSYPAMPYANAGYWHTDDYAEENQAQITETYRLDGQALGLGNYTITNKKYQPHLWMILKWGGVCWQISNVGQNMASAFGVPSTTLGQRPDHVAHGVYQLNQDGDAYWSLINNVYGWTTTDYVSYDGIYSYRYSNAPRRHMNDWGFMYDSRGYVYKYNGTYLLLAQGAINDYGNYLKSHELTLLAETYADDLDKQEEIYNRALEVQSINLDAWLGLIQVYKTRYAAVTQSTDGVSKADQAYLELAKRITEAYRAYPVPMYDMLRLFSGQISDPAIKATVSMMQTRTLQAATKLTASDSIQASAQVTMAKHLLGIIDSQVATFSFDGADAGKIKLNEKYHGAAWEYSLDGGQKWSAGEDHVDFIDVDTYKLSDDEIARITAENDIKIHFSGVPWTEENFYTIDIVKQTLPATLYANDWENRVIGVNEKMEWRLSENDVWTSYRESSPERLGDVTVEVRVGRSGTGLESDSGKFTFTQDEDSAERKYLPIAHIKVASVSSQATSNGGNAAYAIDGNINTRWHSDWNGNDKQKFIVFEFDHDVYLTGIDYLPSGANGRILQGLIEVSQDGENWKEYGTVTWDNNDNWKTSTFEATDWARYVRITGKQTSAVSSSSNFISAKMFNFYEDSTRSQHISAAIGYSTTDPTTDDVIARLIKPTDDTVITNNGGSDTYVFTENGEFTFEFEANGRAATVVARVDWIDREAPTGRIEFYCAGTGEKQSCAADKGKTNRTIEARLVVTNEADDVTVLNNRMFDEAVDGADSDMNQQLRDPFVFTFLRNGIFRFMVQDKAGNIGEIEAVVDWMDMAAPKVKIEYSTRDETEDVVVAKLVKVAAEDDTSAGMGVDENTSEYFTPIEKELYDENGLQYDEDFIVMNNDGSPEYTFTKNGEFVFQYRDEAGNTAMALARVDWIKETEKPNDPGTPDVPDVPENPDTPNIPDTPDQPNVPDVPTIPDNPGGSEDKPGDSDNESDSSNNLPGGNTGGQVSSTVGLPEGAKAENHKLPLTSALVNKFGAQSEYFRLTFMDASGSTVDAVPESVTITISKTKKLKGVYLVKADGTTESVSYERVDDTHILLKRPVAGDYLFEYGKGTSKDDEQSSPIIEGELPNTGTGVSSWWFVVGGVVVVGLIGGGMMANNRRR